MKSSRFESLALRKEIADLRREVADLTEVRDRLRSELGLADGPAPRKTPASPGSTAANVYVLDDDADEAKAFDAFYRAYDEVHAKTRKFLLG